MSRVKATSREVEDSMKKMGKQQLVGFLKSHPLLQTCNRLEEDQRPTIGELVWARNVGSIFWPGFVAHVEDREGLEDDPTLDIDESTFTYVMFLEENFRFAAIPWDSIIALSEGDVELQKSLVPRFNKAVIKRNWHPSNSYKLALAMIDDFCEQEPLARQKFAEVIFKKQGEKRVSEGPAKSIAQISIELVPEKDPEQEIEIMVSEIQGKRKSGIRVSDRIVTNTIEKIKSVLIEKDKAENEKTEPEQEVTEVPPKVSKPAKDMRPDVGGEVLKNWIKDKFDSVAKGYGFESSQPLQCRECDQVFEAAEDIKSCHGLPHHEECLIKQDNDNFKCQMCLDQLCFLCKSPSELANLAHKCTRCDLRFHLGCLIKDWPQAEIQGSNGPFTCPLHFCHTCLGEQKIFGRFRDYTTSASKSYKCLLCLSTYHKTCLPAGCGEDIRGHNYIICPRHKLPNLKVQQRRLGCLGCYKPLKHKEPRRIECSLCVQSFHPECIGYTDEIAQNISLEDFGKGYRCFSCRWGLFPVYGQVVWFQQTQSTYWPARILYPAEYKTRKEFAKRLAGQYSLEYFGSTSFYDNASRAIPLHLTTMDIFKKMNVYQDTPKILRAHEEANFFLLFSEEYREGILPTPKPIYKKIEKNVYRTISAHKVREPSDVCSCNDDDKDSKFVCLPDSGCHNRDMEMECSDKICKSGERCSNRMFVERKNDSDYLQERLFPKKGWGVVAKREFKPGDFVSEYRGEVIDGNEMRWRLDRKEEEDPMYIMEISKEFFIDAEYIGNLSRLINHSCNPNGEIRKYLSRGLSVGGVFAKRHIQIGEEVTFDYGCGSQSNAPFRCRCGAKGCLVFVGKDVPEGFQVEEDCELNIDKWEDVCSACGYGGRVICCEFVGCGKVWHYKCAGLTRPPSVMWYCPKHPQTPKQNQKRKSIAKRANGQKSGSSKLTITKSSPKTDKKAQATPEVEPKKKVSTKIQRTPSPKITTSSESETSSDGRKRKKSPSSDGSDAEYRTSRKRQKTASETTKSEDSSQSSSDEVNISPHASIRKLRSSNCITSMKDKDQLNVSPDIVKGTCEYNNILYYTPPETPQTSKKTRSRRRDSSACSSVTTRSSRSSKVDMDEMFNNLHAQPDEETATTSPQSVLKVLDVSLTVSEVSNTSPTISSRRRTDRSSKFSEPFSPLRTNSYVSSNDKVLDLLTDSDLQVEKSIRVGMMTRSSTESFMKSKEHGGSTDSIVSTVEQLVTAVTDSLEEEIASPCYSPIISERYNVNYSSMKKKKRLIRYNSVGDASTNRQLLAFDFIETENDTESLFKTSSRPGLRHPRHFSED